MIDRKTIEDELPESEIQHRYAHALLRPKGMYQAWLEAEITTLPQSFIINFGINEATFTLEKQEKWKPPMWIYVLKGIKQKKVK